MQSQYDAWQTGHVLKGGAPVQTMGNNVTGAHPVRDDG
jgi:hypothetical protein